jgi:hypothetical protein
MPVKKKHLSREASFKAQKKHVEEITEESSGTLVENETKLSREAQNSDDEPVEQYHASDSEDGAEEQEEVVEEQEEAEEDTNFVGEFEFESKDGLCDCLFAFFFFKFAFSKFSFYFCFSLSFLFLTPFFALSSSQRLWGLFVLVARPNHKRTRERNQSSFGFVGNPCFRCVYVAASLPMEERETVGTIFGEPRPSPQRSGAQSGFDETDRRSSHRFFCSSTHWRRNVLDLL